MAVTYNNSIVTDGLVLHLDAANRKSCIGAAGNQQSLINTDNWTLGTGGVAGYVANENAATENQRIVDTDPWGNQSIVWGTYCSGNNNEDGGWNGDLVAVDKTKLYRYSVWVRRTSTTGAGTFYFGCQANGGFVVNNTDGADHGNPYFDYRSPSSFVQNEWYLVVGHVFPTTHIGTTAHTDSGLYRPNLGKVASLAGNTPNDVRWRSDTTTAKHRTYHYYSADSTTRLQFADPRIDLVDGTEPTITELVAVGASWKDLGGVGSGILGKNPTYITSPIKSLSFNGTSHYTNFTRSDINGGSWVYPRATIISWLYIDPASTGAQNNVFTSEFAVEMCWTNNLNGTATVQVAGNPWAWLGSAIVPTGQWIMLTYRHGTVGDIILNTTIASTLSISGTLQTGGSNGAVYPTFTIMSRMSGTAAFAKGKLANFKIYNRALSDAEIASIFNVTRLRFNI